MQELRAIHRGVALIACLVLMGGCGSKAPRATGTLVTAPQAPAAAALATGDAGAVEVTIADATTRRVGSVSQDIASYRVTLTGGSLTSPLVKLCLAPPEGGTNKVSVRYDDLPPGTYTMTVEVLDDSGTVIGRGSQSGSVTAGLCTYIDINVQLNPTVVDNPNGSLGGRITVTDGEVIMRPIGDCPENDGFTPIDGSTCATPAPSARPSSRPSTLPSRNND